MNNNYMARAQNWFNEKTKSAKEAFGKLQIKHLIGMGLIGVVAVIGTGLYKLNSRSSTHSHPHSQETVKKEDLEDIQEQLSDADQMFVKANEDFEKYRDFTVKAALKDVRREMFEHKTCLNKAKSYCFSLGEAYEDRVFLNKLQEYREDKNKIDELLRYAAEKAAENKDDLLESQVVSLRQIEVWTDISEKLSEVLEELKEDEVKVKNVLGYRRGASASVKSCTGANVLCVVVPAFINSLCEYTQLNDVRVYRMDTSKTTTATRIDDFANWLVHYNASLVQNEVSTTSPQGLLVSHTDALSGKVVSPKDAQVSPKDAQPAGKLVSLVSNPDAQPAGKLVSHADAQPAGKLVSHADVHALPAGKKPEDTMPMAGTILGTYSVPKDFKDNTHLSICQKIAIVCYNPSCGCICQNSWCGFSNNEGYILTKPEYDKVMAIENNNNWEYKILEVFCCYHPTAISKMVRTYRFNVQELDPSFQNTKNADTVTGTSNITTLTKQQLDYATVQNQYNTWYKNVYEAAGSHPTQGEINLNKRFNTLLAHMKNWYSIVLHHNHLDIEVHELYPNVVEDNNNIIYRLSDAISAYRSTETLAHLISRFTVGLWNFITIVPCALHTYVHTLCVLLIQHKLY
jgi:hypothetical protein